MSEPAGSPAPAATTAGRLLREARERQGLHIVALAALIKVAPKKLEMLEADRLDALPDATFARALAQTVCRALKIDAAPVLALLPVSGYRLEQVGRSLNTPFRERPGSLVQRDGPAFASSPAFWITGLILLAAVTVYLLPQGLLQGMSASRPQTAPAATPASHELPGMPPETAASPNPAPTAAAGSQAADVAVQGQQRAEAASSASAASPVEAATTAAAPPAGLLEVRTSASSWVEVVDSRGQALISRVMQPGESVGLDGAPPLRVRIGNAAATRLVFRGQPTELAAFTRDNVARLDLK